ncbi:MAG: dipeptide ABC transporter ATP-binding protein [Myxococcales bacterium]|nr:dipeptide ABC transporter ATP-binding protein [Myxococcales bacterium]
MTEPLLKVRGLGKHFPIRRGLVPRVVGQVQAVDGVDLDVMPGQAVGLVGESGCGKTTTGRCILRLVEPTAGELHFDGRDLRALSRAELRALRREMQIIFQDPFGSLNPRRTVFQTLAEPLKLHGLCTTPEELRAEVDRLLLRVGLDPDYRDRYPHQFSGGQRQRVGIARALSVRPRFIVCDEPVSALDVSVQAQILNLLADLRTELGLSYLFIAHDLAVVRHLCDVVAVMYLGRIVEIGPVDAIFENPQHPYTQALLSAVPQVNAQARRERILLEGDVPTPINPPSGCRFHTRCRFAAPACAEATPRLQGEGGHQVACDRLEAVRAG